MNKLTNKEEVIMQALWTLKQAFVKDILEALPEPKPHYNTVSTIIRLLEDKGFVGHKAYGNTHQYYPIITKKAYTKTFMGQVLAKYFDNSVKSMVAFFAEEEDLTDTEIKEIIDLIENKKS